MIVRMANWLVEEIKVTGYNMSRVIIDLHVFRSRIRISYKQSNALPSTINLANI